MTLDRLRWLAFRANAALLRSARRRLTPAGWVALAGVVGSAAWGLDTTQSMAYQSFALLAALGSLALAAARLSRPPRLVVKRVLPRFGTAGEPLRYSIILENRGEREARGLSLVEELDDPRPTLAEFAAERDLADDSPLWKDMRPFWFDRFVGYTRWRRALERKRPAVAEELAAPDVPARGRAEVPAALLPARRGRLALKALTLSRPEPLGLAKAAREEALAQSVLILPKRYPVPRLALPGARRYQRGGVALSSSVGDAEEFVGLRDYRAGDPPRRVHWRSWAKAGKPVVKEYQDEYFTRHALVLDTFAAPGQEAAFEEAVSVAASFACSVLTQESLLDLLFVGEDAYCFTAGRGVGGAERLLEALACARARGDGAFARLEASVLSRRAGLSGAVCVLLGYDRSRRGLIERLRGAGLPTKAFVVAEKADRLAEDAGTRVLEIGRIAEGLARAAS